MNDKEFKKLQERYFKEINKRDKIAKFKDRVTKLESAIKCIKEANDSQFMNLGEIEFKVYGTTDGHGYYTLENFDIKLDNEYAIDILEKQLQKLNRQLLELKDGTENEEF